jgi:hypothetical protein
VVHTNELAGKLGNLRQIPGLGTANRRLAHDDPLPRRPAAVTRDMGSIRT